VRLALAFAPDGRTFATWQKETGHIEWWDTECRPQGTPVTIPPAGAIAAVCPDKGWMASGHPKGPVRLHDWRTGALLRELPPAPLKTLRFIPSPDGRFLAAFEWPRTLAVCDLQAGAWLEKLTLSPGTAGPVVFSPDGLLLASAGDDNLVTVRRTLTGKVLASLRGHMAEVKALAFSPDGKSLASSSADRSIRLWHVPTWRELGPLHRDVLCPAILFTARGLAAEDYRKSWFLLPGGKY
jgi:WD40 repeat protein